MTTLGQFTRHLDVLVPKDFDIDSIEKCLIDYECNFIRYDNEMAINSRLGTVFVVLQETHFIVHAANKQVNCNYDCRNRIMKTLFLRNGNNYDIDKISNDHLIKDVEGVIHNTEQPYLLFTNEKLQFNLSEDNTIIANYINVDIPQFAEITISKLCNNKYFVVYLGDGQYICCNVQTLETYQYSSHLKYHIVEILRESPDDPFTRLKSHIDSIHNHLKIEPPKRTVSFQLMDIEGHPVEENTEYQLEMYDIDEDILQLYDAKLYATYYANCSDSLIVQCSIIDGIYYLTHDNKYFHVADDSDEISLTDQLPSKEQRLEFEVTERNTFKTVQWNRNLYLTFELITSNYSILFFNAYGSHVELFLKKI
ncbi:hypothetical protein VKS41_004452 [Umbelopsis sp. WA50703]|jgi:hypothetical protein